MELHKNVVMTVVKHNAGEHAMLVVLWINGKVKVEKRVLCYINEVVVQVIVVLRIKKKGMALVVFHFEEVLIVSVVSKMMEIVTPKCHFEEVEAVGLEGYHMPKVEGKGEGEGEEEGEWGMPLPPLDYFVQRIQEFGDG